MNGRPVTDAQIARALRVRLPERAQAGLRERILATAETTTQQRALPSFLGALSEADPITRRRNLLIAAALLVALAFASAAAVGALRQLQRDSINDVSLEPPADLPAFVLSSYERLPQLPPVAFTWHDSGSAKGRVYVHRSGAVRFDRFTSAEATEPSSYTILSGSRISGMAPVDSTAVWVDEGHEAIEDDPRVFLRTILSPPGTGPGCEMDRDDVVATESAARGWRYVGLEYVAGRPTHHVACIGELSLDIDLWLDIETRLVLRTSEPLADDAGQPIPGQFTTTEVTEITFGEQSAALFEPPEGVARMSADAYGAYLCTRDLPDEERVGLLGTREDCSTDTEAEATPLPTPTPMPTVRPSLGPRGSGPAGPLAWSEASPTEDWPAPVRPEPAGGASVEPMPLTYFDPTGDTGSDIDPWVDIRAVMGDTSTMRLKLVSNQPPVVDPAEEWIAYGVVTDEDGDGVPDWRYGIDNNVPAYASGEPGEGSLDVPLFDRTRVWRTNLHTGRTDELGFRDERWQGVWPNGSDANFEFGGTSDVAGQGASTWGIELDMPFYTWASVIVNGRVVATDFAPDAGWLIATPGAKPGGTYLLEDPFLPISLSMSVPDGWTADGPSLWYDGTGDDRNGQVVFMIVDVPEDPCPDTIEPPLGHTVDDLVTHLENLPLIDISENSEVTVDGYHGTYLNYTPVDGEFDCDGGPIPMFHNNDVWILDVDGVRLVIFGSQLSTSSSEAVMTDVREIVDSIQIEP